MEGGGTVLASVAVGGVVLAAASPPRASRSGSSSASLLALAMQRLRVVERALLPYVVLSQTVPLIALAPLVYGWSGNLSLFGLEWEPWMSVSVIAAYLAFFPVAIGALRGLSSPPPRADRAARGLRGVVVADARAAAAAGVGRLPDPGAEARGRRGDRRRDRGRDLDRAERRHRAPDHHLRAAGHRRPGARLRADPRRRGDGRRGRRARLAARHRAAALPDRDEDSAGAA